MSLGDAVDRLMDSGTPAVHGAGNRVVVRGGDAGAVTGVAAGAGAQVVFVTAFRVPLML